MSFLSNLDKANRSGKFPLKSEGLSMLPLLQPGDVIYFKKVDFSEIKVNDLVVIKKDDKFICHRIIYKGENHVITRGDNNLNSDGKIFLHQIIGRVEKVKRKGKFFDPLKFYLIYSTLYFQTIEYVPYI